MEDNRDCHTTGEVYGNSKFADLPFNVDNNWQEKNSQGNQYNGITISNRKEQIAEFSVVTPEQSKQLKPEEKAIFSMIPRGDPDLTAYPNELLRTNKPEQQKTFSGSRHLDVLKNPRITPQYRHESSKKKLSLTGKKYSINKQAQNPKTNSSSELLGLTLFTESRETSKWRCPGLLSWQFRQTQNGHSDEHGIQGKISTERRQS